MRGKVIDFIQEKMAGAVGFEPTHDRVRVSSSNFF